jgi:peptide/nickel transport system permease protein
MGPFIVRRLIMIVPVLLLVTFAAYSILWLIPGDAAVVMLGPDVDPATIERLRHDLGLDRPLLSQYATWLGKAVEGDLGRSLRDSRPILGSILQRLPATIELSALALGIALGLGIPLGILTAVRKGGWADLCGSTVSLAGVSMPGFWLAILLILMFSVTLGWLPPAGYVPLSESVGDNLKLMIMPAVTLGLWLASAVTRQTRASVLEVLGLDYVTTARAKGVAEWRVIAVHVAKNALIPVVTTIGLLIGPLAGGAVITETIFSIPGVGRLVIDAVMARDFPVVQAVVMFMAMSVLLTNLLVDVAYGYLDPRISRG